MATCHSCRFNHNTECRRFPPQVTLMKVDYEVNRYGDRGNAEYVGTQAWPNVVPTEDWCGEHQYAKS